MITAHVGNNNSGESNSKCPGDPWGPGNGKAVGICKVPAG